MNKRQVPAALATIHALEASGISSISEAKLLMTLAAAKEPLDVSALAQAAAFPISTTSRLVWNLAQLGLVAYQPHAKDRRMKLLVANVEALAAPPAPVPELAA